MKKFKVFVYFNMYLMYIEFCSKIEFFIYGKEYCSGCNYFNIVIDI